MIKGSILVLSGPSGCGKSSLVGEILKSESDIYFSISTTTREPRSGEQNGREYFFISKEEFRKDIEDGMFLEWAEVHGNYYGTSLKPVLKALDEGKLVIFDIDVQGHEIVLKKFKDITTSLFITTPSALVLKERLIKRATDSMETINKRIENSRQEMQRIDEYDFLLINDDFEKTLENFRAIVKSARLKLDTKSKELFINSWYNT